MKQMVEKIRLIEKALGVYDRTMTDTELQNRKLSRRSITIKRDMQSGERIVKQDLMAVRPGTGIEPKYINDIIGKKVTRTIKAFELVHWEDLR